MPRNFTRLMALAAMFLASASIQAEPTDAKTKADQSKNDTSKADKPADDKTKADKPKEQKQEGFVIEATDATFTKEVLKSKKPVLVDFWAPWCGPCRLQGPIVDEVSVELNRKLKVVKLDTEANQKTALKYGITNIPALYIFKKGKVVQKIIGLRPKEMLVSDLSKHIK